MCLLQVASKYSMAFALTLYPTPRHITAGYYGGICPHACVPAGLCAGHAVQTQHD